MNSSKKGANAERELRDYLVSKGYAIERGETRSYGVTPDLYGLPGIHIEVKRRERLALPEWIAQSERDAVKFGDGVPTVIFRQNRQPWRIVLQLDDFLRFYAQK